MFTDMIAEEEYHIKQEEQWYDHQDLEHDLHLAAELGKTLLERNHELEEGLQEMYTANQEQLQEIEHLSKQVEMLRSVNDQHAKVYEQLDATARDLEQSNQRLTRENRSAQQKIEGLTETINGLQGQVDELQRKIEKMTPDPLEPEKPDISQSDKYSPIDHSVSPSTPSLEQDEQEEEAHTALLHLVHSLQAELNLERALRETAEQEAEALARGISELELHVSLSESYKARLAEAEAEVEELRQLVRSNSASRVLPGTMFYPSEGEVSEMWAMRQVPKSCNSERQLLEAGTKDEDLRNGEHNNTYKGHFETVKSHGVSLFNEVDAQYSALQRKYNALLHRCEERSQSRCDKAVQTSTTNQYSSLNPVKHTRSQDCAQLPEYKMLFNEIFTCLQNSKKDLEMSRAKSS